MSKVYIEGPNGLVIGFDKETAEGLLRHPDIKKAAAPEPKTPETPQDEAPAAPAGNASKEDWYAYALVNGKTSADLEGLGQREIRALFTEA
jgi:hypothetical protein